MCRLGAYGPSCSMPLPPKSIVRQVVLGIEAPVLYCAGNCSKCRHSHRHRHKGVATKWVALCPYGCRHRHATQTVPQVLHQPRLYISPALFVPHTAAAPTALQSCASDHRQRFATGSYRCSATPQLLVAVVPAAPPQACHTCLASHSCWQDGAADWWCIHCAVAQGRRALQL
jgi:hypothetical protein